MARVLVVEDDPTVARLVELSLGLEGFEVETAGTASVAAERLEEAWDVIVLDVHLPGTSGLELLRHLREEVGTTTPVIILSGQLQSDIVERALRAGADRYLTKPFSPDDLLEVVQMVVRHADE